MIKAALTAIFVVAPIGQVQARNTPCSGKMGGVAHCSKDGKFVCNNGKISQSKKLCR